MREEESIMNERDTGKKTVDREKEERHTERTKNENYVKYIEK